MAEFFFFATSILYIEVLLLFKHIIYRGPEMNHKCFFHLFDIACCIAIYLQNETISDLWRKNIHISYILGRHSFEIFLFFLHIPKNQNLYIFFKKRHLPYFTLFGYIFINNPEVGRTTV